jgi:hypothetical protein
VASKIKVKVSELDAETILYRTGQMTLLYAMLLPGSTFGVVASIMGFLGLFIPGMLRQKWFFAVYAGVAIFNFFIDSIWAADNHNWLQWYWLVALALANFARDSQRVLALSARLLVGFTFLFATTWKILSHDFPSGAFFEFASLTETRLAESLQAVGFDVVTDFKNGTNAIKALTQGFDPPASFELVNADLLSGFWPVMAFVTIVVEGAIAVVYLAPLAKRISWIRDAIMVGFCVVTYVMLPVGGFGMLLTVMGFASSDLEVKRRTWIYGSTLAFILLMVNRAAYMPDF